MEINRLSLIEGAQLAAGLTVIIDVFRAFTTDAYIFGKGAERIFPVSSKEDAFRLKKGNYDWILIGEEKGKKIEGFDFGNSPFEIMKVNFDGQTIIQRTSAGTQGIMNATNADEILLGSFVMAAAIVDYIRTRKPKIVSLVAMGLQGSERSPEDELFAEYLEDRLKGKNPDFKEIKQEIREHPEGAKFFDSFQPQFIEEDFYAAMDIDHFDFCLKVIDVERPCIIQIKK
jgi:2-phosphosulfolactate phosphatase